MREHARAEVRLVVPLDFRHRQQAVDPLVTTAVAGVACGGFVFADVPALELSGAVHRREPSGDAAEEAERPPDQPGAHPARSLRRRTEFTEHLPEPASMVQLFLLDR